MMRENDAKKYIGYRCRVQSEDLSYDGLEGKAIGLSSHFGPTLELDVAGRRWLIALEDIVALVALRPYRVVVNGAELPSIIAESDDAAVLEASQRASRSSGEVYEVWDGPRLAGWATVDSTGAAS